MTIIRNPIDRVVSHFYYLGFLQENDWDHLSQIDKECGRGSTKTSYI